MATNNPDARTVKPAGTSTFKMTGPRGIGARQTLHCNEGEWGLAALAGRDRREAERGSMDRSRRP